MFGSNDKRKNAEFVGKVQAARQQRAEEKERERAAICIQVMMKFDHLIYFSDRNKQTTILRFLFSWLRVKSWFML